MSGVKHALTGLMQLLAIPLLKCQTPDDRMSKSCLGTVEQEKLHQEQIADYRYVTIYTVEPW